MKIKLKEILESNVSLALHDNDTYYDYLRKVDNKKYKEIITFLKHQQQIKADQATNKPWSKSEKEFNKQRKIK